MSVLKDICRICLQEANDQEIEEINLGHLNSVVSGRPFISFSFLGKWQTELFRNHLICSSCIHGFRTIQAIYRASYRANGALLLEKNTRPLRKIDLKRLKRFRHIDGDFLVCRLCLNPTSEIAIYLYDNKRNILPVEYITKMLKHIKVYMNFDRTINPILCHGCWQDIQSSYSFSKHIEVVTEKMFYYQALTDKIYVDREDLQVVLHMWDQLGVINIKTEVDVIIKEEIPEEYQPKLKDTKPTINQGKTTPIKKNPEYSFYDEHNYFKMKDVSDISINKGKTNTLKRKRETTDDVQESSYKMPVLEPSLKVEDNLKKMPKLKPNIEIENIENKTCNNKSVRSRIHVEENKKGKKLDLTCNKDQLGVESVLGKTNDTAKYRKIKERCEVYNKSEKSVAVVQNEQEEESQNSSYREKLRSVIKHKVSRTKNSRNKKQKVEKLKKGKIVHLRNKQKKIPDNPTLVVFTEELSRPRTRLSTKSEIIEDPLSQDLLVLRREEIIKKKPQKRKLNASLPKHTSTPKISKNKQYGSVPAADNVRFRSNSNTEYTFESLNMDDEVQVKKEVIVEEELQIKREILSECESDDLFTEITECNRNDDDFDDECPNLESFIKSEPPDESDMIDLDEEGPPELEFQGPCIPIPMPNFTIHNTFTVDEKRHLINTGDDKRNLLKVLDQQPPCLQSTADMKGAIHTVENKIKAVSNTSSRLTSSQSAASDCPKLNSKGESLASKLKDSLLKILLPKSTDKDFPNERLVDNINKFDERARTLEKDKKSENVTGPSNAGFTSNANVETLANTSDNIVTKRILKTNNHGVQMQANDGNSNDDKSAVAVGEGKTSENVAGPSSASVPSNVTVETQGDMSFIRSNPDALLDLYQNLGLLLIDELHPYFCKACDFSSTSHKAARIHMSLHLSNTLYLHRCKLCSFASSRKVGLADHIRFMHYVSSPDQSGSESANTVPMQKESCDSLRRCGRRKCKDCKETFHSGCVGKDVGEVLFDGRHPSITSDAKNDIEAKESKDQKPKCDFCRQIILKNYMIKYCWDCNKVFHLECLKKDLMEYMVFNCRHQSISRSILEECEAGSILYEKDLRVCDFCQYAIFTKDLMKSCTDCDKVFHPECLKNDLEDHLLFNCQHQSVTGSTPKEHKSLRNLLTLEDTFCCAYCILPGKDKISCMKCKNIFHRNCFAKELRERKFDCEHYASPPRQRQRFHLKQLQKKSKVAEAAVQDKPLTKLLTLDETFCCDYCNLPGKDKISCMKCKNIFHRNCFAKELRERKFDCEHYASPPRQRQRFHLKQLQKKSKVAEAAVQDDVAEKQQNTTCKFCQCVIIKTDKINYCAGCKRGSLQNNSISDSTSFEA